MENKIIMPKIENIRDKYRWFIDIDGTICEDVFPYLDAKETENNSIIMEIKRKLRNVFLYPEFIEFFKKNKLISCQNVYFITGRKYKYFSQETRKLLEPLEDKNFSITVFYYPDSYGYTKSEYFNFKINRPLKTISMHRNKQIIVIDDIPDYFEELVLKVQSRNLRGILSNIQIKTHNIVAPKQWLKLLEKK